MRRVLIGKSFRQSRGPGDRPFGRIYQPQWVRCQRRFSTRPFGRICCFNAEVASRPLGRNWRNGYKTSAAPHAARLVASECVATKFSFDRQAARLVVFRGQTYRIISSLPGHQSQRESLIDRYFEACRPLSRICPHGIGNAARLVAF
jgi:hypothetical protein